MSLSPIGAGISHVTVLREGQYAKQYSPKLVTEDAIGVSNSTITRELRRNSSSRGVCKWDKAQRQAEKRKYQMPGNRSIKPFARDMAIGLLKQRQWSPEQRSGYLAKMGYKISHETIYAIIRMDKYEDRGSLYKHCRHRLKHRHRPVGKRVIIARSIQRTGKDYNHRQWN